MLLSEYKRFCRLKKGALHRTELPDSARNLFRLNDVFTESK